MALHTNSVKEKVVSAKDPEAARLAYTVQPVAKRREYFRSGTVDKVFHYCLLYVTNYKIMTPIV